MHTSLSEEDYLKAIFHLEKDGDGSGIATNDIALRVESKASSVTEMMKKLVTKNLVTYKRYKGSNLTPKGREVALKVIRKHRLWETFLVQKLGFRWDEVHELAEQLEHIKSDKLVDGLDAFLGHPDHDPHGDPIPEKDGTLNRRPKKLLLECKVGEKGKIIGLADTSSDFLRYLQRNGLVIGTWVEIDHVESFDGSMTLNLEENKLTISRSVSSKLYLAL
jgi:DtxR family Mn-dependent transcriptional regulator